VCRGGRAQAVWWTGRCPERDDGAHARLGRPLVQGHVRVSLLLPLTLLLPKLTVFFQTAASPPPRPRQTRTARRSLSLQPTSPAQARERPRARHSASTSGRCRQPRCWPRSGRRSSRCWTDRQRRKEGAYRSGPDVGGRRAASGRYRRLPRDSLGKRQTPSSAGVSGSSLTVSQVLTS
jgi:hypothetical protein